MDVRRAAMVGTGFAEGCYHGSFGINITAGTGHGG